MTRLSRRRCANGARSGPEPWSTPIPARAALVLALVAGCDEMPRVVCMTGDGARSIDVDGDGRADVQVVLRGGQELCRASDLNLDGRPDEVRVGAPDGAGLWLARDFDGDGRADHVELRVGELVVLEVRDLDGDGRADRWRSPSWQTQDGAR